MVDAISPTLIISSASTSRVDANIRLLASDIVDAKSPYILTLKLEWTKANVDTNSETISVDVDANSALLASTWVDADGLKFFLKKKN
jgi:hypothetical protein